MKSRQSSKQEISAYKVKGFLKLDRDQPPFYLISHCCIVQNILDRPYGITNSSILDICTLIMMNHVR